MNDFSKGALIGAGVAVGLMAVGLILSFVTKAAKN